MADNAAAAAGGNAPQGGEQQQPQRPNMLIMMALVFFASQFFLGGKQTQAPPATAGPSPGPEIASDIDFAAETAMPSPTTSPPPSLTSLLGMPNLDAKPVDSPFMMHSFADITPATVLVNLFPNGVPLHIQVYGSISDVDFNTTDLLWDLTGVSYTGDELNEGEISMNISLPSSVLTWKDHYFIHIFVSIEGYGNALGVSGYEADKAFHLVHPMTRIMKVRNKKTRSLLGGEEGEEGEGVEEEEVSDAVDEVAEEELGPTKEVMGWKPSASIVMLHDFASVKASGLMPNLKAMLKIGKTGGVWGYFPMTHVNEFWLLTEDLIALNETVKEVPLTLSLGSIGKWKLQLQSMMVSQWQQQQEWGLVEEGETDEIKRVLLETDPWLLGITAVVSTLHMLFDFLAFKNDISFWKNNKSMEGLSLRAIITNVFFQLVITLYLLDNETSWMILLSQFVGLAIEIWKLRKAVHIKISFEDGKPKLEWKDRESYTRSRTKEYDDIAMAHLMYALIPLSIGYAVYSLMYEQHKGWYSWVISSLTGFVYTFGFVFMTPQLFINYKKKSVAHMPWRAMVYKSLNTFIDDLFAFVIKMPMMHRISCFRDDLIFFIYLYQRWVYKVDPTRKNEFGVSQEDLEEADKRSQLIKDGHKVSRRPKRVRIFPEAAS